MVLSSLSRYISLLVVWSHGELHWFSAWPHSMYFFDLAPTGAFLGAACFALRAKKSPPRPQHRSPTNPTRRSSQPLALCCHTSLRHYHRANPSLSFLLLFLLLLLPNTTPCHRTRPSACLPTKSGRPFSTSTTRTRRFTRKKKFCHWRPRRASIRIRESNLMVFEWCLVFLSNQLQYHLHRTCTNSKYYYYYYTLAASWTSTSPSSTMVSSIAKKSVDPITSGRSRPRRIVSLNSNTTKLSPKLNTPKTSSRMPKFDWPTPSVVEKKMILAIVLRKWHAGRNCPRNLPRLRPNWTCWNRMIQWRY